MRGDACRGAGGGRQGVGVEREVIIKVSYKSSDVEIDMDENKSASSFLANVGAEIKSVLCK